MSLTRSNIKIEPMRVTWGSDVYQVESLVVPADAAGSMNNKYFFFHSAAGVKHYVWFNINSAGTDPAISGATAHAVTGATGATGTTLAAAAAAVIDAISGFDSTSSGTTLTITQTAAGYAQPAYNGSGSFSSFTIVTQGDSAAELGYCDGEIEFTPGEDKEDVMSHQTGKGKLGSITTGFSPKVKMTLKETSTAQIIKAFIAAGATLTPTGSSSTQVVGYGTGKLFQSNFGRQAQLRLHPVALGSTDYSRDITFWKTYPVIGAMHFSGEKVLMLPLEFEVYQDSSKNSLIDYFAIGDGTQTLT